MRGESYAPDAWSKSIQTRLPNAHQNNLSHIHVVAGVVSRVVMVLISSRSKSRRSFTAGEESRSRKGSRRLD